MVSCVEYSAMIKEQNQGLAAELEGFSFKPRINKTSMELSATMKSLTSRIKEMQEEREKDMDSKRKASERQEIAECTFAPKRNGAKTSDTLLKKLGREKLTPDDLFRYEDEKKRRNEIRRQIVDEVEERELTFRPRMGERSVRLQEKLVQRGVIEVDPLTRTAVPPSSLALSHSGEQTVLLSPSTSKRRHNNPLGVSLGLGLASGSAEEVQFEEGPLLQIESEHPYRHNTNEYTTVQVPGAVSYCVRFHEDTRTEPIYDFVKFYDNETHTEYFGAGKYSGGTNGTSCNWPGVGGRPPLIIPASKFIIHFKTNGSLNDWGFRMHIVPTLSSHMRRQQLANAGIPVITDTGRHYQSPTSPAAGPGRGPAGRQQLGSAGSATTPKAVPVHLRLYQEAVERTTEQHNAQVISCVLCLSGPSHISLTTLHCLSAGGPDAEQAEHPDEALGERAQRRGPGRGGAQVHPHEQQHAPAQAHALRCGRQPRGQRVVHCGGRQRGHPCAAVRAGAAHPLCCRGGGCRRGQLRVHDAGKWRAAAHGGGVRRHAGRTVEAVALYRVMRCTIRNSAYTAVVMILL
jgi:hypothetical protein